MEEIEFKVYFNNNVVECTGTKISESEQSQKWKVSFRGHTYIFQNNWPLLKGESSRKRPQWRMIQGEVLVIDHAKEVCEEIALALENAIKRSEMLPYANSKN